LRRRLARLPDALRALVAQPDPQVGFGAPQVRRIWVTGVGNSAAPARFLADVLDREVGIPARYVATGALAGATPADASGAGLIVFSQGLSPNARFALTAPQRWASLVLVTATGDEGGTQPDRDEKASFLASLRDAGATIVRTPGEDEYGTLVRVIGPMLAYAAALAVARAWGRAWGREIAGLGIDAAAVEAAWLRAPKAVAAAFPPEEPLQLERGMSLLASGGYGERVQGWRHKVLEGMGLPWPPLWDMLDFAHGPYQQHVERECEVIVLARSGDAEEEALLSECKRMLHPGRHRLRVLMAQSPDPLAVLEHEAQGNALLLRWLTERESDPRRWAGQGRDAPLYERSPGSPRRKRHQTNGTQKE